MAENGSSNSSTGEARLVPLGSHAAAAPIPITRPATLVGSRKDIVRLHLESSTVSKAHCVIVLCDFGCYIHDLGSRTHTWVNGKQVVDTDLADGDLVQIGRFKFRYEAPKRVFGKSAPAGQAELSVSTLTDALPITKRVLQIGRRTGSDLQFDDDSVSNIHAILFERNGKRYARDIGSRKGTWLDGTPIHQEELSDGAVLRVGPATITLNELATEVAPSPSIPLPLPMPPAFVRPEPPQISKTGAIELEPLAGDDAPLEVATDDQPAAELSRDEQVADEVSIESEELSDEAIAAELNAPAGDTVAAPALEISLDDEIEEAIETPAAGEPAEREASDASDEDALAALRRGWHGAARVEESSLELAPEVADEAAPAVEPEAAPAVAEAPAAAEPEAMEPVAIEPQTPEPVVEPLIDETAEAPAAPESALPEPPVLESLVVAPIDDVSDDDGAIDLDEAPPMPVAESLAEPELALEPDAAGLTAAEPVAESEIVVEAPAEPERESESEADVESEAEVESDTDLVELETGEVVIPADRVVGVTESVADESEDEFDAPVPLEEIAEATVVEPVAEAPVEPAAEYVTEAASADSIEPSAEVLPSDTSVSAAGLDIEEMAEAVVGEPAGELDTGLDLEPEDLEPDLAETSSPREEALAELDLLEETPVDDEPGLAIDLSQTRFDTAITPASDLEIEDEPEAVAELESIDFSDIAPEKSAEISIAPANFQREHIVDESLPEDAVSDESTSDDPIAEAKRERSPIDFSGFEDDNEPVEPLMNLADSIQGEGVPSIEIVEETLPTPASAMPLIADDYAGESDEVIDAKDLIHELDVAAEPMNDTFVGLPESEGGEPVETTGETGGNVVGASVDGTDGTEIEDEFDLDDLPEPPPAGNLNDLIPRDGPMLGGAFSPQSQTFLMGGSPLVEVTGGDDAPSDASPQIAAEAPDSATPDDRRKPLRVGFNGTGAPAAPAPNPFAGANRTIADTIIGRRGQQSVDVFSNPSPTPEDLLLDEAEDKKNGEAGTAAQDREQQELLETAGRFRPRGAISALESFPQIAIPPVYRPEEDPVYVAQLRRGRLRRVLVCVLALIPLIGGVVYGVQQFVPVYSKLVAAITYDGLANLSVERTRNFKHTLNEVLSDENTRVTALAELGPDWEQKKGFLADTQKTVNALVRAPGERWPAAQPNQMHLIVNSRDKEGDLARLRALAKAVVKSSESNARRVARLREEAREDEAQIQAMGVRVKAVTQEIEELRAIGDSRPDNATMDEVEARRKNAEADLKAARAKRLDTEAAIELLQRQTPGELAPSPEADLSKADEELSKLTAQLEAIQKESEAVKTSVASKNDEARKALDAAITQFQTEVESAQKLKDNPALVRYLEGAKRFFSQARTLTDDLIRRQENQQTRLSELKQRLGELMEKRTKEILEKDGELKRLNDELSMLVRQQNAVLAEGEKQEADKLALKMELIRTLIRGREDLFKNDPVHAEAISAIEQIIEQTKKSIPEDRKHIDATLSRAEEDFSKSSPSVEQLPAEQKQLAESLEKRLAAVAEARKAYSATADAADVEIAKTESSSKEKVANLQLEMRARKQLIEAAAREKQAIAAEENRKKRLEDKKIELAAAVEKEKQTNTLLDSVIAEKEKMEEHRRRLVQNDELFSAKSSSKAELDMQIKALKFRVEEKQKQIADVIVPDPKVDIQNYDNPDRRPIYAGAGAGAIFVLMLIPIVYNLRLISRDSHQHAAPTNPPEPATTNGFDPIFNDPAATDDETRTDEPAPDETVATR